MNNIKLIKIILIEIFTLLLTLEGLFLFVVPASVNKFVTSEKLHQFLFNKYGLTLITDDFRLITYPNFKFRIIATEFSLGVGNNRDFAVKKADIIVKMPSLLLKKITFSSISAHEFSLKLTRKLDGNFYFCNLPLKFDKKNKFSVDFYSGNILNSNISLVDDVVNNNLETRINTMNFLYKKKKLFGLKLDAVVSANNKKNIVIFADIFSKLPFEKSVNNDNFICDISVKNLDLKIFSSYFKHFSKGDVIASNGLIDLSVKKDDLLTINAGLKNFSVDYKNPLDSIRSQNDIYLTSKITFEPKTIVLKEFVAKSINWSVKTTGKIKNFASLKPSDMKLDLTVDIPSADIHSLYWLTPTLCADKLKSLQKLKKHGVWGLVSGVIQLKGFATCPELYGDLVVDDVYIVKNNPLVPHSKVFASFKKDYVTINSHVWAGAEEYVDVEGLAELKLYGKGDFRITSSKNVDLGTALYMLVPIQELVGFDLGPVPYMDISGKGNIDIRAKGTILDGEIDGVFNFKETLASLEGLNLVLKNADGSLSFDKKDIHFSTNKAFVNGKPIKVDGLANLSGRIDFNIFSNDIDLSYLLAILNTSEILESKRLLAEPIEWAKGKVEANIKLTGIVKDFSQIMSNETVSISGNLIIDNAEAKLKDIPLVLSKIKGSVHFNNDGLNLDLLGKMGTSVLKIVGFSNSSNVDFKINGEKVKLSDIVGGLSKIKGYEDFDKLSKINSLVTFVADYKLPHSLNNSKLSFENLNVNGKFIPIANKDDVVKILDGNFILKSGSFILNNFKSRVGDSDVFSNLVVKNVFSSQPVISGQMNAKDFELSILNTLKKLDYFPDVLKKVFTAYTQYNGKIDVSVKAQNNNFQGNVTLNGISFVHSYFKTPIRIDAGNIVLDGTKIILKSVIAQVDNTPLYLNFVLNELDKTMKISGYITTKFTESFANKYINTHLSYPIKPKGDITVTANISGSPDKIMIKPVIKFNSDADIYYMGANLGNVDEERQILATLQIVGNQYHLKNAEYVRFMTSQNDKSYPLPIILANGIFEQNSKDKSFSIKNLNIKTLNSANAKLFNVLFRKSILKQGLFNCNVNIKGDVKNPKIIGDISLKNIDVPLYDTTLKNINLKLNDKTIDVDSDGIIYNSDVKFSAALTNSMSVPYTFESFDIKSDKLNLDKLIDALTFIPTPNTTTKLVEHSKSTMPVNISDIRIKKGSLIVKDIIIRELLASNYQSRFSLGNDMVLNVDHLGFDVTTGKMTGTASYNFKNGRFKTNVSAVNVDSNKVASSLFGFENQIFGQANGNIVMTTTGSSEEERIKNATGYVYFEISDGKMPKLGSVEYLLKAGNFVKSGITGASINNLLELLAPVKTGYFNSIKGSLALKNGVAQDIEIYSKGDNLNLYINGEYTILQKLANMRVYGRLTKKASSVLGPIGNLSLNSLLNSIPGFRLGQDEKNTLLNDLNKIPGVELSDKDYRRFTVKIDGEINDDNKFVKNFRWID